MGKFTIPDHVVRAMIDPAARPRAPEAQQHEIPPPEIRVRPVVRYAVTRFFHASPADNLPSSSEVLTEVDNERNAEEIAAALRAAQRLP